MIYDLLNLKNIGLLKKFNIAYKTGSENLTTCTTMEPEKIYKLKKEKGVGEEAAF